MCMGVGVGQDDTFDIVDGIEGRKRSAPRGCGLQSLLRLGNEEKGEWAGIIL